MRIDRRTVMGGAFCLALAFVCSPVFPVSGFAQDDTDGASGEPRPALIEEALDTGEVFTEYRWSFLQTMSSQDAESEDGQIVMRFDPREEEAWTLIEPTGDAVTDEIKQVVERIRETPRGERSIGQGDLSHTIGGEISVAREEASAMVYRFEPQPRPDARDGAAGFLDNLEGELTVQRSGGGADGTRPWIRSVRLHAPQSFKPNLAARINTFEQSGSYALVEGVPVLAESVTRLEGSAMFRSFNETVSITLTQIERIDPAQMPATAQPAVPVDTGPDPDIPQPGDQPGVEGGEESGLPADQEEAPAP